MRIREALVPQCGCGQLGNTCELEVSLRTHEGGRLCGFDPVVEERVEIGVTHRAEIGHRRCERSVLHDCRDRDWQQGSAAGDLLCVRVHACAACVHVLHVCMRIVWLHDGVIVWLHDVVMAHCGQSSAAQRAAGK